LSCVAGSREAARKNGLYDLNNYLFLNLQFI